MRQITEIQKMSSYKPVFILILFGIGLPSVIVISEILQSHKLQSDEWMGLGATLLVLLMTAGFIFWLRTEVRITDRAVLFKANPFLNSLKKIELSQVEEFYISNHKWHHGLGYKATLNSGKIYVLKPGKVLVIKTTDGRQYRFGINRPTLVKKFINDHWTEKEVTYG